MTSWPSCFSVLAAAMPETPAPTTATRMALAGEFLEDGGPHLFGAYRLAALGDVAGPQPVVEHRGDGRLEPVGQLYPAEGIAQRHRKARQHGDGIGEPLAGDVGSRAVHRLV